MKEIINKIIIDIKQETSTDPIEIFNHIASKEYIHMHGPEHHILDGACILMAYNNAGGNIKIDEALEAMAKEGLRMPGAMCGLWGVCGAITSVGAALSIIDQTGPLSTDGSWGNHMFYTSRALENLATINGPRCCKRDAMIAFMNAIDFINDNYSIKLTKSTFTCTYSQYNAQCIKERCPFHQKNN